MNCLYELNEKYLFDNCNGIKNNDKNYILINGNNNILLSASHAVRQRKKLADSYTGAISEYIAKYTGSSAIIRCCNFNDNPNEDDYGFGLKYKEKIIEIVKENNIEYMFDIHGCSNYYNFDICIGTNNGKNISKNTILLNILDEFDIFDVRVDKIFKASNINNISRYVHNCCGVDCIQLEISNSIRCNEKSMEEFINRFSNIICKINK